MRRLLPLVFLAAACGPREPGPHPEENGQIFFWEVTESKLEWGSECSDRPTFRSGVAAPVFEPNSFLIYKISADGKTAKSQHCETTLPSSCSDNTDTAIEFAITDHTLVFDPPADLPIGASDCKLSSDQKWTLTDKGETLDMDVGLAFDLVGDPTACAASEGVEKSQAPNGKGFDGCVLTIKIATKLN